MPYQDIFDSKVYQQSEHISDTTWEVVMTWPEFAREAFGKQFVEAADSIGANIAESAGRYYPLDVIRFLHFARGSVRESQHWTRRAWKRRFLADAQHQALLSQLNETLQMLNSYIKFQRSRKVEPKSVKESSPTYTVADIDIAPDETFWPDE